MAPSLPLDWQDDPPQEIRALLPNLLHDTLSLVVVLLHFMRVLLQLRPHPRIELITLISSHRSSALPALIAPRTVGPGRCRLSLSRSNPNSPLHGDPCVQRLPKFSAVTASSRKLFAYIFLAANTPTSYVRSRAYPNRPTICHGDLFSAAGAFHCFLFITGSCLPQSLKLQKFLQRFIV